MANLSATQLRYLANAWICFDSEPKIDYDRFAALSGLKTAASAREMLRQTKKKLMEHSISSEDASDTPAATPSKRRSTGKGGDSARTSDGAAAATPSKKRGRKAAKKGAALDDGSEGDDHEDEGKTIKKMKKKVPKLIKDEPVDEGDTEA